MHIGNPVKALRDSTDSRIVVLLGNGLEAVYDHVILATHGDQALDIMRIMATAQESEILSGFQFSENTAVLHSDLSVCSRFLGLFFMSMARILNVYP